VTAAGYTGLTLVGGAVTVALATLPDMDIRIPGIAHRGPTHTLWFALLVGLVIGTGGLLLGRELGVATALTLGGFGFLVGALSICSHIAADALTPMGVTPFTPLSGRHVTYDVVNAKNRVANYLFLVVGLGTAGGAYALAVSL
jgi:inner membrane protein